MRLYAIKPEPASADVAEALDEVRLRADDISALCISWVNRDGTIESVWTKAVNGPGLLAAVTRAMHLIASGFGN